MPTSPTFDALFVAHSRQLARQLLLRRLHRYGVFTLPLVTATSLVAGVLHQASLALGALLLTALSIALLELRARRAPWTAQEVALFLDARLAGAELVTTALELQNKAPDNARPHWDRLILERASQLLADSDPTTLCAPSFRPRDAWMPLAALGILLSVGASFRTPRSAETRIAEPDSSARAEEGTPRRDATVLRAVEALDSLPARDAAQATRLAALAQRARALRTQLEQGQNNAENRAATEALARDLAAEQRLAASPGEQAALEAAAEALAHAGLQTAADALRAENLDRLERELARGAYDPSPEARSRVREALQQALRAAEQHQSSTVASALREQLAHFDARTTRADATRALAQNAGNDAVSQEALRQFDNARNDSAQAQAARAALRAMEATARSGDAAQNAALRNALSNAARALESGHQQDQVQADGRNTALDTSRELQALSNAFDGPTQDGPSAGNQPREAPTRELNRLRDSLSGSPNTQGAQRSQGLAQAEQATQRMLAGMGSSQSGQGAPSQAMATPQGAPQGSRGQGNAPGAGGSGPGTSSRTDPGRATQSGQGPQLQATGTARGGAQSPAGSAATVRETLGGAQAQIAQTNALQTVAPGELEAMEASQVPGDYQQQVRSYFQP